MSVLDVIWLDGWPGARWRDGRAGVGTSPLATAIGGIDGIDGGVFDGRPIGSRAEARRRLRFVPRSTQLIGGEGPANAAARRDPAEQ